MNAPVWTTILFLFFLTSGSQGLIHDWTFPAFFQRVNPSIRTPWRSPVHLQALIYGWDDGEDDLDEKRPQGQLQTETFGQCSPEGATVAEALSYDQDRVGSLARLAVAFAPPSQGLSLDVIEKVDVLCVNENHIDIQVVICENGGCLTVAVPITFPKSCSQEQWLEGCVSENLQMLEESAKATLVHNDARKNSEEREALGTLDTSSISFPSWWVHPVTCEGGMVEECNHIQNILNEADFQRDIVALAQFALNHAQEGYADITVQTAKVSAIGPAGLCFKVRGVDSAQQSHLLDALYPFGGEPLYHTDALRAAVLGLVATAD